MELGVKRAGIEGAVNEEKQKKRNNNDRDFGGIFSCCIDDRHVFKGGFGFGAYAEFNSEGDG